MLLRKPRVHSEVYNDVSAEIVNVFRVLRHPQLADALRRQVELTPFARDEFEASYEPADDPVEGARRTIARAFMGFGSASVNPWHSTGFRSGSRRSGTPPASDWFNWPAEVEAFTRRLRRVVIENRDALDVIAQQDGDDTLFYVDPPYPHETRGSVRGVRQKYARELTTGDHRRLAEVLHQVKGMVVLSGYPCRLYDRDLYSSWRRETRTHLADGARKRTEVVWLNPACDAALRQTSRQCALDLSTSRTPMESTDRTPDHLFGCASDRPDGSMPGQSKGAAR